MKRNSLKGLLPTFLFYTMTPNYYYHNGASQVGPFSLEELIKQPVKADTQVWKEGTPSWQSAKDLPEIASLLRPTPPPMTPPPFNGSANTSSHYAAPPPETKKKSSIWGKVLFLLLLIIAGLITMRIVNSSKYSGGATGPTIVSTYQERKMSVLEVEQADPARFLRAFGNYNRTLFGKKIKVHGSVTNSATVANFKDIEIEVVYYSATRSIIDRERFTLYDFVPAHSTKSFEWKISPPQGTETLGWEAVGAVAY